MLRGLWSSGEKGEVSAEQGGNFGKGTVGAPKGVQVDMGAGGINAGALSEVVHKWGKIVTPNSQVIPLNSNYIIILNLGLLRGV